MAIRISDLMSLRIKQLYKAMLGELDFLHRDFRVILEKVRTGDITRENVDQYITDLNLAKETQRKRVLDLGNDAIRDVTQTLDVLGIEIIVQSKEQGKT